jgi:hypothetical protein
MLKLDLSRSFTGLLKEAQEQNPNLNLDNILAKVNTVLSSYADELDIKVESLTLLHMCISCEKLHPNLVKHLSRLPIKDSYRSQHQSRLKNLTKAILCPRAEGVEDPSPPSLIENQLPEPLQRVWPFLPRQMHRSPRRNPDGWSEAYLRRRSIIPLSANGVCIGLALLKVWNSLNPNDVKKLIEECSGEVTDTIRCNNQRRRWSCLDGEFHKFMRRVRAYLKYEVTPRQRIELGVDQLPEPLRTQVLVYKERARYGFNSDLSIKILARKRYGLHLGIHSKSTIEGYIKVLGLGLGYIAREIDVQDLNIKDLLRLVDRNVEVDGMLSKELYNPLVDY